MGSGNNLVVVSRPLLGDGKPQQGCVRLRIDCCLCMCVYMAMTDTCAENCAFSVVCMSQDSLLSYFLRF